MPGQDLPLNLADKLRNHPVVRSFFMVGKDSPPTPLWQVLLRLPLKLLTAPCCVWM